MRLSASSCVEIMTINHETSHCVEWRSCRSIVRHHVVSTYILLTISMMRAFPLSQVDSIIWIFIIVRDLFCDDIDQCIIWRGLIRKCQRSHQIPSFVSTLATAGVSCIASQGALLRAPLLPQLEGWMPGQELARLQIVATSAHTPFFMSPRWRNNSIN